MRAGITISLGCIVVSAVIYWHLASSPTKQASSEPPPLSITPAPGSESANLPNAAQRPFETIDDSLAPLRRPPQPELDLGPNGAYHPDDRRIAEEPIDPAWAPAVESEIRDLLQAGSLSFAETVIECRTRICRIKLQHASLDIPAENERSVTDKIGELLQPTFKRHHPRLNTIRGYTVYGNYSEDGITHTRIYMRGD